MSQNLSQDQIEQVFRLAGLNPIERGADEIRELITPESRRASGYITILTNGTGKQRIVRHAELELGSR
jgi:hypothetical protein